MNGKDNSRSHTSILRHKLCQTPEIINVVSPSKNHSNLRLSFFCFVWWHWSIISACSYLSASSTVLQHCQVLWKKGPPLHHTPIYCWICVFSVIHHTNVTANPGQKKNVHENQDLDTRFSSNLIFPFYSFGWRLTLWLDLDLWNLNLSEL